MNVTQKTMIALDPQKQTDSLDEVEELQGEELAGPLHDQASKPTILPKKKRGSARESHHKKSGQ